MISSELISDFRCLLSQIIPANYLPKSYFSISDTLLTSAIDDFQGDYNRWYAGENYPDIQKILITPQLIAMLCYRIAHNVNMLPPPTYHTHLRDICRCKQNRYVADAYSLLGRQVGQIEIYYSASIGKCFKINHGTGSVIGARCKIGADCTIHQNCTIGDRNGGRPTIGDNVMIYAGSMILGDITIGDNCIIGANSVVTKSCPPNSVIVGTPGKIVKKL